MFSHITVGTTDLEKAETFYDALLLPLGIVKRDVVPDGGPQALCWLSPGTPLLRFYVYQPFDGDPASAGNGTMIAFNAPSSAAIDTAFNAALANGGTSEGEPGPRPHYSPGYYGAYLRDPDGNKIHITHRSDL